MSKTKRAFDIVLAAVCALLLLPIIAAVCIALKTTSPGPLLFRQQRVGRGGKIFLINKFRKFPSDWGNFGPGVTLQGDSRMTNIGQFLERTKLDEIPQLWNILIGEMSFVGPRPESLAFNHLLQDEYTEVLNYTPGLFGPNQVKFRNESAMYPEGADPVEYYEKYLFPAKAKTDIEYFGHATFLSDMGWLMRGGFALVFSVVLCKRSLLPTLVLALWDVLAISAAWLAVYWLKFTLVRSLPITEKVSTAFATGALVLPGVMLLVFSITRVYRNPVRYFGERDAFRLIGVTCVVWIVSAVTVGLFVTSISSLMLSVACLISLCLLFIPRIGYAYFRATWERRINRKSAEQTLNILVCGISTQSLQVASLLRFGFPQSNVIGLVSPNKTMVRREVKGFTVVGTYSDLDVINSRYHIDQIWYAPGLLKEQKNMVNSWCINNQADSVSIASQPGFRRLLLPEYPVVEQAGAVVSGRGKQQSKEQAVA